MQENNNKKISYWFLDLAANVIVIVILVIVIQKWIIAPFNVSGSSMCDTLNFINNDCQSGEAEKIIINEATYVVGEPKRGDIVVFKAPNQDPKEDEKYFIKRVIGLPGETIELKEGKIYITDINGKTLELEEEYLNLINKNNTEPLIPGTNVFNIPKEKYFLMGDNRKFSMDSRSCFTSNSKLMIECSKNPEKAFVEKERIRGKAWVVWWPLPNARIVKDPTY